MCLSYELIFSFPRQMDERPASQHCILTFNSPPVNMVAGSSLFTSKMLYLDSSHLSLKFKGHTNFHVVRLPPINQSSCGS